LSQQKNKVALKFGLALFPALLMVYAIYNPEGVSYYHKVLLPLSKNISKNPSKPFVTLRAIHAFVGVCLMIGILFYFRQVVAFVGATGAMLSVAFFGTFHWVLIEEQVLSSPRLSSHLILVLIALFVSVSTAWPKKRPQNQEQQAAPPSVPPPSNGTPPKPAPQKPIFEHFPPQ